MLFIPEKTNWLAPKAAHPIAKDGARATDNPIYGTAKKALPTIADTIYLFFMLIVAPNFTECFFQTNFPIKYFSIR